MIVLDNHPLTIDDRVYEIINGYGTVTDISSKTIVVKFPNGRRMSFSNKGEYKGIRRLYWHNPIFISPPKDINAWSSVKSLLSSVLDVVRHNL